MNTVGSESADAAAPVVVFVMVVPGAAVETTLRAFDGALATLAPAERSGSLAPYLDIPPIR